MQVGTDIFRTRKNQFGAFFGYEDSKGSNLNDSLSARDRIAANNHYAGLYHVNVFSNGTDFRTILNFGWQDYQSQRNGNDGNLYQTSFSGNTTELNFEIGRRYYHDELHHSSQFSIRPVVALDWYFNRLGGGTETSQAPTQEHAIRYGSTHFSQLLFRFGTDFRYEQGRGAFEGGLYYSYDLRGSDFWASASSVDGTNLRSAVVSSSLGRSTLSLNVGGSYLFGRNLTVFGGYRGEASPDRAGLRPSSTAYAGGALKW
jgi:hypothetical protein